jgi:hypothetical protein
VAPEETQGGKIDVRAGEVTVIFGRRLLLAGEVGGLP